MSQDVAVDGGTRLQQVTHHMDPNSQEGWTVGFGFSAETSRMNPRRSLQGQTDGHPGQVVIRYDSSLEISTYWGRGHQDMGTTLP